MSSAVQLSSMSDGTSSNDGEGVWSPDIEQAFQEALLIYKPCGRRKHIIQDEGNASKMYGRNELIARHIKTLTGKTRTRKQVSSHIQVLARRKAKQHHDIASTSGTPSPSSEASSQHQYQPMTPHAQHQHQQRLVQCLNSEPTGAAKAAAAAATKAAVVAADERNWPHAPTNLNYYDLWQDRPIATHKIRLVEFSAFIEHRNPPPLDDMQALSLDHYATLGRLPAPLANSNNQLPPPVHLHHQHQIISQQHQNNTYKSSPHMTLTSAPVRHCYIRIDYSQPSERFLGKQQLEQIDISQIQDKFPNIGGPTGLIHRAPTDAFFLVKFWADISGPFTELAADDQNSYFGFSTTFETMEHHKDITCSTKACSYGLQVVEKVDKMYGAFNSSNGRYSYTIESSPMCDFMSKFIRKLRQLPRVSQMNSVLENFTVLQVISSESTSQILLCLAYVFEVASTENHALHHQPQTLNASQLQPTTRTPYHGPQYHVYKLTKDKAFLQ